MECRCCQTTKLPNEFPPDTLTENCEHPVMYCLRCTIKHVEEKLKCPHPNCGLTVEPDDATLSFFRAIVSDMFKEYNDDDVTPKTSSDDEPSFTKDILTVTLLTGECISLFYDKMKTIIDIKNEIMQDTKHDPRKQKLLYRNIELEDYIKGNAACLSDYNVEPNSTLCLVVRLYSIPTKFDEVIFDLNWGYPSGLNRTYSRDYLDATCFLYGGKDFKYLCDYCHRQSVPAIRHSGDVMNDKQYTGHHKISVSLKKIPSSITHLFFTLSAWNSPTISRYRNPKLNFYQANDPSKDLCETMFTQAKHSQAVIMCSVSRNEDGQWEIFNSGKCSGGNAKDYNPIKATIEALIESGL